jgi:hypothetical protein
MEGLTAKVFRTYNASITLQEQLEKLTDSDYTVQEKVCDLSLIFLYFEMENIISVKYCCIVSKELNSSWKGIW